MTTEPFLSPHDTLAIPKRLMRPGTQLSRTEEAILRMRYGLTVSPNSALTGENAGEPTNLQLRQLEAEILARTRKQTL